MPDYSPRSSTCAAGRCLVVGGGRIAERRVPGLLQCAARVTVVSPTLVPGLARLAISRRIDHRARAFPKVDVRRCLLVIAATGVAAVDDAVAETARRHGALVNALRALQGPRSPSIV